MGKASVVLARTIASGLLLGDASSLKGNPVNGFAGPGSGVGSGSGVGVGSGVGSGVGLKAGAEAGSDACSGVGSGAWL